ncbi:Hemolysin-related protein RbmC [Minicystis rosea]|nr:Hemolysin-related protein RbmC [Minicystis rosea]
MSAHLRWSIPLLTALVVSAAACGGGGEVSSSTGDTASSGSATTGSGGSGHGGQGHGGGITLPDGGGDDAPITDPCVGVTCDADQHCAVTNEQGSCVNNTCADLSCTATEACTPTPGGGAICKDISCTTDANCPTSQYCNGTICVDDTCVAGTRTCVGDELHECAPNGGGDTVKYLCGSQSYYSSPCVDPGQGDAHCPCEDDWDCPANTVCEAGKCTGTGKAPTCTLPPVDFTSVLPVNEIQWGGLSQTNKDAVNAPFPTSSQACATPIVVNLDDDNGDGLINELDFPEIVFMTYCGTDIATNGIVRAIHGGGPNKGKDYFATCGNTVWHEGDPPSMSCACGTAEGNSTAAVAVADLDNDGVPEIVVPTENDAVLILDNKGVPITRTADAQWVTGYVNPAPTIANIDNQGFAEIVVGNNVFTLDHDANNKLVFVDRFAGGTTPSGMNGQGPVPCVANIAGDSRLEIVAGTMAYALPVPPPGVKKRADCVAGATDDFCTGKLSVVWDAQKVNGTTLIPAAQRDGFCAIADVLGADEDAAPGPQNPLDGKAEVVVVAEGYLVVLNGETGTRRRFINLGAGADGGAPNIDDFDGDGFPEIGTAFGTAYLLIDLQDTSTACPAWPTAFTDGAATPATNLARTPGGACTMDADCAAGAVCNETLGSCVCLHNGWRRTTEDDSSRVTSSSVFDFNGDGAAEVVYNDECYFRIYDGRTGGVLFKHHSPSRTRIENPAIADVDNDGNAEIVFPSNNDASSCSEGSNYPNGIAVWGDASDTWVSARRIWNQHSYHVTNVTEGGAVPMKEPESWKSYNGRTYNTYRSNPRSYAVAPDLTVKGVQVSSPDATCGQLSEKLTISVQIDNAGDLRVGPGVVVTFYGAWQNPALSEALHADTMGTPLTYTLQSSLEPGGSIVISVAYDALDNTPGVVPDEIRVIVDEANTQRECDEMNNELTQPVMAGTQAADLRIALGTVGTATCPLPSLPTTIFNDGSMPASNVLVRYYAGDPSQGGAAFHDETVAGPIAPGGSTMFTASLSGFPKNLSVLVYAVVDPDNAIPECNDGNNKASAADKAVCSGIQ